MRGWEKELRRLVGVDARRRRTNATRGIKRAAKGRQHDFHLFKQSHLWVRPQVEVFCDMGCQGLQKLHASTRKPQKATKKRPLTREQKQANCAINSRRVVIEHAIRRLKAFRLPSERYRWVHPADSPVALQAVGGWLKNQPLAARSRDDVPK